MRAVLFDLDGTLLDIDIDAFMTRYLAALAEYSESLYPGRGLMDAMMVGVREMMGVHPGRTNQSVFYDSVLERTGIDLDANWSQFESFYSERFEGLRGSAGPRADALAALELARELGAKIAVATNPMFPRVAIERRMAWAGLDGQPFDLVTTYEDYYACKPHAAYFRQIAEALEVSPAECLMVGDDVALDMPAAITGMRTFYVGGRRAAADADYVGKFADLARLLPELLERRA